MITIRREMRTDALHNVESLTAMLFEGESYAHEFIIGPGTADFTGFDVSARFVRADGQNVAIEGELSEGSADVILTPSCYAMPGAFELFIYVTQEGENDRDIAVCVYAFKGSVCATVGENGTAGGTEPIIESYSQESRISALEARVAALEGGAEE